MVIDDKILIFYVPRSGSSSLTYSFHQNWDLYSEPLKPWGTTYFDYNDFMYLIKNYKGLCIKTSPNQLPKDYNGDIHKFFDEIYPYFDKIIFLDRLNTIEQEKSYKKIWDKNKLNTDYKENLYYQKWKIREILKRDEYSHHKLYYYEDFFMGGNYKEIFKDLKIPINLLDESYFSPSDKYTDNLWHKRIKSGKKIKF